MNTQKLIIISVLTLLSCSTEPITTPPECEVYISLYNTHTGEPIGTTVESYQILYDYYIDNDWDCTDKTIEYGNQTVIYKSSKTLTKL